MLGRNPCTAIIGIPVDTVEIIAMVSMMIILNISTIMTMSIIVIGSSSYRVLFASNRWQPREHICGEACTQDSCGI